MADFDPNHELDTQEQADAYLVWCAENFLRLSNSPARSYRTGIRCAHWLFILATAQMHLDDLHTSNREALLEQLSQYQLLGRALERQRQRFPIEQLIVLRASLDCWEPTGRCAANLLDAAKMAVAAMILTEAHPLIDLWDLHAPDVWALLGKGRILLAMINDLPGELEFEDFAVRPGESVTAKFTWQKLHHMVRHAGIRTDLSEN